MVYWKYCIEDIRLVYVHPSLCGVAVGYEVLVGEHDGLWSACGSACEEESSKVIGHRLLGRLKSNIRKVEYVLLFVALLLKAHLEAVLAILANPLVALAVHEKAFDFNEIDKMLDLSVRQRIVDRDYDCTHVQNAHVGKCPFRAVLSGDGNSVAFADALGIQPRSDLLYLSLSLSVCEHNVLWRECLKAFSGTPALHSYVEHLRK